MRNKFFKEAAKIAERRAREAAALVVHRKHTDLVMRKDANGVFTQAPPDHIHITNPDMKLPPNWSFHDGPLPFYEIQVTEEMIKDLNEGRER